MNIFFWVLGILFFAIALFAGSALFFLVGAIFIVGAAIVGAIRKNTHGPPVVQKVDDTEPICVEPVPPKEQRNRQFLVFFLAIGGFVAVLAWISSVSKEQINNQFRVKESQPIQSGITWNDEEKCRVVRSLIRLRNDSEITDAMLSGPCTVEESGGPLPKKLESYTPYAVSWPSGVAMRIIITKEGLEPLEYSNSGIPANWKR